MRIDKNGAWKSRSGDLATIPYPSDEENKIDKIPRWVDDVFVTPGEGHTAFRFGNGFIGVNSKKQPKKYQHTEARALKFITYYSCHS